MDSRKFWRLAVLPVIAAGALISATTVNASTLVADGITYELTATGLDTSTAHFTLDISGINGAADTELGRYGVEFLCFQQAGKLLKRNGPRRICARNWRLGFGWLYSRRRKFLLF